ncbi:protein kinase domain-containing protein [Peribacillus sp. SCS-155]|uniref:protein kinase domain-containing protein n=1 Tax=Peribacillus sedimenti TaxID=3115297 RepID=UPI00390593AD
MMNTLRNQYNFQPGEVITGKWYGNKYKIIRELGCGANGIVYLAEYRGAPVALKLSQNGMSIISEMNVLKSFNKVQGSALGPYLIEADDYIQNGRKHSFYAMEYIRGDGFLHFVAKNGHEWIGVLLLQLLKSLSSLHKKGWVFGDLKPENLIVTTPSYIIRCVDVGGTTVIGRSIKEFTEFFDRGYWGLGTRKAEPSYDLFAVAMIIINTAYPARFSRKGQGYSQLRQQIQAKKELWRYKNLLENALSGKYMNAEAMRNDLMIILQRDSKTQVSSAGLNQQKHNRHQNNKAAGNTRAVRHVHKKNPGKIHGRLLETLVLVTLVSVLYILYLYSRLV